MTAKKKTTDAQKRAEEKSRRYSNALERLLTVSREMTSTTDVKKLYRIVVQTSIDLLQFDFSTLMTLSDDKTRLTIEDTVGFPDSMIGHFSLVEGQGLSTYVIKSKAADTVLNFSGETRFDVPPVVREKNIRSALCVPMMLEDEVFGVLIGHTLDERKFSHEEVSLYQNIGNEAAVAIKNAMNLDALRKSEKKLSDITSHIAEGLYVIDPAGQITFMNKEAERLLGWTRRELNEKGAHALIHNRRVDGTPLPLEACRMHNVIKTGKRYASDDEVFVRRDGTVFPISAVSSPIIENNRIVASVTAFRDIAATKKLEQEVLKIQKLESVGILAGGIAHDFNNLLTAIIGNVSLSRLYVQPDSKVSRLLTDAESACAQARDLSYRLLTFSKGGEPVKQVLSITKLLRDAVALTLSSSSDSAEFSLPDDLPPVEADQGQMKQVIGNLVTNAKEAMPSGGVVRVSAERVVMNGDASPPLKPGLYLKLSVSDRGAGISPENLPRIFDPYFSTKEMGSEKGRGLGLAICHSIVRKHDGLITAESTPGKGTTFTIFLPAIAAGLSIQAPAASGRKAVSGSRGNVLVMDDEECMRGIVKDFLEHLGYEAECAREGGEAVTLYRRAREQGTPFVLVILDLTVAGGMGGLDTLKKLWEMDPKVQAVVSSGYADDPILKDHRSYGFAGAIAKPYTIRQLDEALRNIIKPSE